MLIYFIVSVLASIVGAICGIGGGVVIKPALDLLQMDSGEAINFLSGCTVLAMSCYSVLRSILSKDGKIQQKIGTPLALGAVAGGIIGKRLYTMLDFTGTIQSVSLGLLTMGTLVYTIHKKRIHTKKLKNRVMYVVIGWGLGVVSSFLGIGGGPFNLAVLYYFFDMDTKEAASNSLYIILFSQLSSLIFIILSSSVPEFRPTALFLMIVGGISGGIAGREFHKRMSLQAVDRLFIYLMEGIILICVYNTVKCLGILS